MSAELGPGRAVVDPLRRAMYHWDADGVRSALASSFTDDAQVRLGHPFEDLDGARGLFDVALGPLSTAWPDLERRDHIVIEGTSHRGDLIVGCCGHYSGTFVEPWLGIPPTRRPAAMRFHEFYRVEDGRIVEMQALWDLPEVMIQAAVWPMGPSLGREWHVPGPATSDGLGPHDDTRSEPSMQLVLDMLSDMKRHPTEPVETMQLERYWSPSMSWYGPSGIGTARGIDGFRRHHQIPFLSGMPDRRGKDDDEHFFSQGNYVAVTGWPNMQMTLTGDGWMGIAPADRPLTLRSLDFWRLETASDDGLIIRENWVLIDLLNAWHQLGVDVLARMRELA